jgi:endoglucanase
MTVPYAAALTALALFSAGCTSPEQLRAATGRPSSPGADEARRPLGPYAGETLFVEPTGNAADQADAWRTSAPDDAAVMDQVAEVPISIWVGDWLSDVTTTVDDAVTRAGTAVQVLTVYAIPDRDCGSFSAGGVGGAAAYQDFVDEVAAGLDGRFAIVVLEPDALALVDCLDTAGQDERHQMLSDAVDTLTAAGAAVYLDAGDSAWIPSGDMADRLLAAGVQRAAGFALNVSHTEYSVDEHAYAAELRAVLGDSARYVIDTSRNGLGPDPTHEWCNPAGRAHGRLPTLRTRVPGLDARLWIKRPGESDGECAGGPAAGAWWPEYALELALNAGFTP